MLKLWFDMRNDAFAETGASECARILRELAERIEYDGGLDYARIRDRNGNHIGEMQMSAPSASDFAAGFTATVLDLAGS